MIRVGNEDTCSGYLIKDIVMGTCLPIILLSVKVL